VTPQTAEITAADLEGTAQERQRRAKQSTGHGVPVLLGWSKCETV
jgi:hypothetical protein